MKIENKITVKVDIPEGYEICNEESTFENIVLVKKEEDKRKKLGKIAGYYISPTSSVIELMHNEPANVKIEIFILQKNLQKPVWLYLNFFNITLKSLKTLIQILQIKQKNISFV